MFKQARIKLTVTYLAIIMTISICFSAFIFRMVSFEFERRISEIERRVRVGQMGPPPSVSQGLLFISDIKEAQDKVLFVLIYTNIVILVFSSFAGYFLAGTTLRPIEIVVEEQKRFVADASHELKTPLTALQTSIEVTLRDKNINLKKALYTLKDSLADVKNLTLLTNDLLSLTRYQQNGSIGLFKKINIGELIDESIENIRPISKKKNIDIRTDINKVHVNGNREDLSKLITILLDNAIKYTPDNGKVDIKSIKKNRNAVVTVSDTGIGVSKSEIPLVFERFYRTDASRSKVKASGFGLGLSIAKSIVDIHKGSIEVDSVVGKGSTFTVKLPVK